MNIFIIPSWYPDEDNPVDGIFIKEQTKALAELYPESNFMVSHCRNFYLSVSKLKLFIDAYGKYLRSKDNVKFVKNNLIEFYKPVITWSEKLGGEFHNLLTAHDENFTEVEKKYGKIDVIHAHVSYPAGFAAMKLKEKYGVPYVITEHMAPFPFERYLTDGKISDKITAPVSKADEVITVSNYTAYTFESYGLRRPIVIPNIVDENIFMPKKTIPEKNKLSFLSAATFTERKGIRELLEGIKISLNEVNTNEFMIAGRGELEKYIQDFISENKLEDKITLIKEPSRNELVELYRSCDAFILPSRLESFGIVYIEAMACGKPVIATDCGGPSDFMKKDNGLLIPINDPAAVSEAIISMSGNITEYSAEKIRDYFMKNFSKEAVCPQIISVYEKAAGES